MHNASAGTEVIRVMVAGKVREYPALFAEYGDHLAEGGELRSLHMFMRWAKDAFKTAPEWMTSFTAWVSLDETGLAYRVSTQDGRHHVVEGAAPMSSQVELLDLYHA
jgi:hypothetical protein